MTDLERARGETYAKTTVLLAADPSISGAEAMFDMALTAAAELPNHPAGSDVTRTPSAAELVKQLAQRFPPQGGMSRIPTDQRGQRA